MKQKMFMIGCNYWDSVHGTDMWRYYDPEVIEEDLKALSENGVRVMRVFPNWRDFQPIYRTYEWRNNPGAYVDRDERPIGQGDGVDPEMLDHFTDFCARARTYNIDLVVSVLTGWMSGRMFVPPALEGKNLIHDGEVLMWAERFIRRFVSHIKDEPNILYWDLGNECNCLSDAGTRGNAYTWTALVANTIRSVDPTRRIMSGMHALSDNPGAVWNLIDQGELTDVLTTHPYPSPTIGANVEPINEMRTTIAPTAQTVLYSSVGGRPAMIQEQGTFNDMLGHRGQAADFVRANLFSSWAAGSIGYFFWCAHEHLKLKKPPYSWSMIERELGLLDVDRKPKPVAAELKAFGEVLDALPFEALPPRKVDACCIATMDKDPWPAMAASYILAKQAGLEVTFRNCSQTEQMPEVPIYILPSISGWRVTFRETYDYLIDRVENGGATLYISADNGMLTEFERFCGLRSHGVFRGNRAETLHITTTDGTFALPCGGNAHIALESIGAEVMARNDEGNPLFARHRLGKGWVYFLSLPLEEMLWKEPGSFADAAERPYYQLYREFGRKQIECKLVTSRNPMIGVTEHQQSEQEAVIVAVNYDSKCHATEFVLQDGWSLEPLYGELHTLDGCHGAIYRALKK